MGCGRYRWAWGRGGPGRRPKPRFIDFMLSSEITFIPYDRTGNPISSEPICLMPDELEALRLVYFEKLTQEEAAKRMGVSRGTLWRILENGRRKLVQALVELRPIILLTPSTTTKESICK